MTYDYLIVGAGLFGATFANMATRAGKKCLVVEKRDHIGGNAYTEMVEGISVHKYGAHIFHTDNKEIWGYVNSFVPFIPFVNSPIARYGNELYNLPFNMNTFHQIFGSVSPYEAKARIDEERKPMLDLLKMENREPANLEEQAISLVGRTIYDRLIRGYTEKQWGRRCVDLPAFIIKRLPLRFTYDNNYFNDAYQGIPKGGYTKLVRRMLEGSEVWLSCDFFKRVDELKGLAHTIVYTGCIDAYFGFCYGPLEYRSLYFETKVEDTPNFQGNAVVNYTNCFTPQTRVIEHKHFECRGDEVYQIPKSVITYEYPTEWNVGKEPYYPINDKRNNELYRKYAELAKSEKGVYFGGRLAEYKYYDMAPTIDRAIELFKKLQEI